MNALILVVGLFAASAHAAPAPAPAPPAGKSAPAAVKSSTAAPTIGFSTYTVSTLYTGDRVRDPFQMQAAGGPSRARDRSKPLVVDIHALQLRGIMKDAHSDFALFSSDDGTTLVLRGTQLYDGRKPVPGITGRIVLKQRRAELMTADRDVQVFTLGEAAVDKP